MSVKDEAIVAAREVYLSSQRLSPSDAVSEIASVIMLWRSMALDEACEEIALTKRSNCSDDTGVLPPDYFDEGIATAYDVVMSLKEAE